MKLFTHTDRDQLDAAERHLERVSRVTGGHGVEAIWLDQTERSDPRAVPDALYVNRSDPYVPTQLYDAAADDFLNIGWGDWLEHAERSARTA